MDIFSFSKCIRTGVPVLNAADPLLDDGLDGLGGELLLGHAAVVARVNPAIMQRSVTFGESLQ